MIFEDAIYEWRNVVPWLDDTQVEQDLILTSILQAIYSEPTIQSKLAFRGGTCLNKLFWPQALRYSEDLDFVQTCDEKAGPIISELRKILDLFFKQKPKREFKRDSVKLYYKFQPSLGGLAQRKIKIEINTREHIALDGLQKRPLAMKSMWRSGEAMITTYTLEELLATKVRALYQRRKGRDLFDLWKSRELSPNWDRVAGMFLKYMQIIGKPIYRGLLIENLEDKLRDVRFIGDIEPLILKKEDYNMNEAAEFVCQKIYSLISESKEKQKSRGVNL